MIYWKMNKPFLFFSFHLISFLTRYLILVIHFLLDFFVEVETEDFGEAEEINCDICEFGTEVILAFEPSVESFANLAVEEVKLHVDVGEVEIVFDLVGYRTFLVFANIAHRGNYTLK